MRSSLAGLVGILGLLSLASGSSGCKDKGAEECARFTKYSEESGARAMGAVPMGERQSATTGPARAAWHRKLADAFEAESRRPAEFTSAPMQDFEVRLKGTYTQTATALRKTADGFDKSDKTLVEQGQIADSEATTARQAVSTAVQQSCTK